MYKKRKQNVNYYENGSTLRGIGAGLYGIGEGILDTATMGMTDDLTDKGFEALQKVGGASESEKKTQLGIKGATNLAGAAGAAIVNPASLGTAIGEGAEGVQDMGAASGNENLQQLTGLVGTAGNMVGGGIPGMPQGGQQGANPQAQASQAMGQGMSFNYGGNMYLNGGPINPPKNTLNPKILQTAISQVASPGFVGIDNLPDEQIQSFEQINPSMRKAVQNRYKALLKEMSDVSENNQKQYGGNLFANGGSGDKKEKSSKKDNRTANQKKVDAKLQAERQAIIQEIQNLRNQVDSDESKRTRQLQPDSPGVVKLYPNDPRFKKLWNPSGSIGARRKAMEIAKPKYIYWNENTGGTMNFPVFEDSYNIPHIDTSNKMPSLDIKEPGKIPTNPIGNLQGNFGKGNLHREYDPYTKRNVPMSFKQADQLSKAYFKGEDRPDIDQDFKDRISRQDANYNQILAHKSQNPDQYPELQKEQAMLSAVPNLLSGIQTQSQTQDRLKQSVDETEDKSIEQMRKKALGTRTNFKQGGPMSNGGFGSNNLNQNPVTEFGAGGTHEENKLGGIPQGIGENGKPNLVEEGELKIKDPRNPEDFYIISADKSMKITKNLAEKFGLSKKYAGKTVKQAAEKILRKDSKREGDTIEENSKNLDLKPLVEIHDVLTQRKEEERQAKFQEELGELEEEYPEYMKALQESSDPQPEQMPQQQMPQAPQQGQPQMLQGMGMKQGMPPMKGTGMPGMRYGSKANSYADGGPGSGFDASMNFNPESLGNPYANSWEDQYGLTSSGQTKNDNSFQPLTDAEKQLDDMPVNEVNQTALNAAGQLLPAAYNIGMGLGKDDPITSGRVDRQELERMELGQAEIDARQNAAASRRNIRNSGVGQAGYLSNVANVQNQHDSTMAKMHSNLRNQNAQIDNQQARMDMQVDRQNIGLDLNEQQMQRQAERERQAMMAAGVSQVGQFAQAQQQDELGAAYANMYSPDFPFQYNKPFDKLKKD